MPAHRPLSRQFTTPARLLVLAILIWTSSPSRLAADASAPHKPIILAHYMPWYTARPFSDHWGWHWTMNHFDPEDFSEGRRRVASHYYPLIGPYDSGDAKVLEYHLLTMKAAGIDGVIVDWYGLTDFRDYGVLHHNTTQMLMACERLRMKFVICYEDQTIPALISAGRLPESEAVDHAVKEIDWLGKYWFRSGSYLKRNGRPVLLSFGHSGLNPEQWEACIRRLNEPVAWFSQDYRRKGAIGAFGWPAPNAEPGQPSRFLKIAAEWTSAMPAAYPRFHDIYKTANAGPGYPRLSDQDGKTFRRTLQLALDSNAEFVQIATWNDWGEGTQIEPDEQFGFRDLEHLQTIRLERNTPGVASGKEQLRLPLKLFRLRHANVLTESEIQTVTRAMVEAKWSQAEALLSKYSAEANSSKR